MHRKLIYLYNSSKNKQQKTTETFPALDNILFTTLKLWILLFGNKVPNGYEMIHSIQKQKTQKVSSKIELKQTGRTVGVP